MNLPQAHFLFLFNLNSNFPKKLQELGFQRSLRDLITQSELNYKEM